jgi:hypothetical protein
LDFGCQGRELRVPVRFLFSYNRNVPSARDVSYCDTDGITHSVEVIASSLYEAAALALHRFQQATLTTVEPGPASRLTVTVKGPAERHQLTVARVQSWLETAGKSPNEQALKSRLRGLLAI